MAGLKKIEDMRELQKSMLIMKTNDTIAATEYLVKLGAAVLEDAESYAPLFVNNVLPAYPGMALVEARASDSDATRSLTDSTEPGTHEPKNCCLARALISSVIKRRLPYQIPYHFRGSLGRQLDAYGVRVYQQDGTKEEGKPMWSYGVIWDKESLLTTKELAASLCKVSNQYVGHIAMDVCGFASIMNDSFSAEPITKNCTFVYVSSNEVFTNLSNAESYMIDTIQALLKLGRATLKV